MLSLRNFIQEKGIPSPLAPSVLVAFYDTQGIRLCYSFVVPNTTVIPGNNTPLHILSIEDIEGFVGVYERAGILIRVELLMKGSVVLVTSHVHDFSVVVSFFC